MTMSPESISKELKLTQSINKNIYDSSPNIIFVKSLEGVYQLANKAMVKFVGIPENEILGKTDADIVLNPTLLNSYKREDDFVIKNRKPIETQPAMSVVKGDIRWLQTVKSPLFDEQENIIGILGIVTDVTALKKSNNKIIEQEKLLKIVFNSGTDFIAVIEPKNDSFFYVSCNNAYLKLLSNFDIEMKTSEDLKGLEFNKIALERGILNTSKINKVYSNFKKVIRTKKSYSIIDIIEAPENKQKLYIDVEISPILDNSGAVEYLIYRGRDFSELMKFNVRLQEREELLESINRNVQDGIYRSTVGHGLRYANNAMCKMFGYSLEELAKTRPNQLYANNGDREKIIKELRDTGNFSDREVLFQRKDKSTFWAMLSCCMTHDANGTSVIDGIIVDVTEKRKNSEELKSINESLRKTNSELDHLVYRTSHDLRSPLASIMGLMELIRLEGVEGETAEYISIMEDQVTKLDKVILDIINIRKIAKSGLQKDTINCQEIIDEVFESIKFLDRFNAIEKKVTVVNESVFIQDKNNVQIILNNVLSNAVKYSKKKSNSSFISVDIKITKNHCSLIVKDNGIGICKHNIEQVFDMFYRATDINQGTGLGLFIVKEALEKLKGNIEVNSVEGEWTCFKIEIPNLI